MKLPSIATMIAAILILIRGGCIDVQELEAIKTAGIYVVASCILIAAVNLKRD